MHQHLEAQLGLLDPSLDVHRYRRVLETFYGFYVPVEIDVTRLAAAELPLGFPLRARRAHRARSPGARPVSGGSRGAPAMCDRPELSCVEDLAGCLYVLEGACLGGQVLSPLLHRRLGLAKGRCCVLRRRRGVDAAEVDRHSAMARRTAAHGRINRKDHQCRDGDVRCVRAMGGARGDCRGRSERCDREPIHIPGTIQPFGVLFALDEEMKVTQVSENVSDHLSLRVDEALGRPLSEIVDPAGAEEVRSVLREQRWHDANPLSIGACGKRFDGIVHHHEGAAILELEPNPETPEERSIHHPFRAALLRVQRASTLSELAAIITQEMRRTTGFERVMFYRFHEDGSGSVDAEARDAAHEPYLGLHYPASDIPAQARRLYLKNWLRLIFDADQKPARIVPALRPDTGAPLDLSFSVLRSVSPIHIEYMKNMGVRASMSISLIVRISCGGSSAV